MTSSVWPPSTRTFKRVFEKIDADAFNQALYGFLQATPPAAREPAVPGLLPQAAADGKTARGAVRPDGSRVHLLSAYHVTEDRTMAQREVDAKTNEIPGLAPTLRD
jgi:hypothetical protein